MPWVVSWSGAIDWLTSKGQKEIYQRHCDRRLMKTVRNDRKKKSRPKIGESLKPTQIHIWKKQIPGGLIYFRRRTARIKLQRFRSQRLSRGGGSPCHFTVTRQKNGTAVAGSKLAKAGKGCSAVDSQPTCNVPLGIGQKLSDLIENCWSEQVLSLR